MGQEKLKKQVYNSNYMYIIQTLSCVALTAYNGKLI